jgi:hypothetical protein
MCSCTVLVPERDHHGIQRCNAIRSSSCCFCYCCCCYSDCIAILESVFAFACAALRFADGLGNKDTEAAEANRSERFQKRPAKASNESSHYRRKTAVSTAQWVAARGRSRCRCSANSHSVRCSDRPCSQHRRKKPGWRNGWLQVTHTHWKHEHAFTIKCPNLLSLSNNNLNSKIRLET